MTVMWCVLLVQCWSSDGYHLWMLPISRDKPTNQSRGEGSEGSEQVLVMEFMRNSLVSNPVVVSGVGIKYVYILIWEWSLSIVSLLAEFHLRTSSRLHPHDDCLQI